jgi:uncharacterized protein YkwD
LRLRPALVTFGFGAVASLALAQDALDKQYLSRRNTADETTARGLLDFAQRFRGQSAKDRARTLAETAQAIGTQAQAREAATLVAALEHENSVKGPEEPELETRFAEALARFRKPYDELVDFCEKRKLAAEGDDAKARLARLAACSPASSPAVDPKPDPAASPAQTILERVNSFRKDAGLGPVELDPALSKGCQAHAHYLVLNDGKRELEGLHAHEESRSVPGATTAGARAAKASDIAWGDGPAESVDAWMATLYHRVPILRPELARIGAGFEQGTRFGRVCVLDLLSGTRDAETRTVVYPADKAANVPLRFGTEIPDPVPAKAPRPNGFPITCTGYGDAALVSVTAGLEADGKKIDCFLSTPEKPATSFPQANTICLIPKAALSPKTTYTARFRFSCAGERREVTTTFETRPN